MELDCVQMLQLICQEDCAFPVRKKALHGFKNLLGKIPAAKVAALVSKINLLDHKSSLVKSLLSCGDREFQEYLIEILTRLARSLGDWKNVLKSWFHNFPVVADAVDILESKSFDVKCRIFLNLVNESCYIECRIHSLPCLYATVTGQIELEKPSGYDELWIDCSPRTGDIQLLVDGNDGSWARVTLHFGFIQSIKCRQRKWRLPSGDVESSQLLFEVQPSIVVPFETPVSFTEVIVVLKKDLKFQELENGFLKVVYANYYEPDRADLGIRERKKAVNQSTSTTSFQTGSSGSRKFSLVNASLSTIEKDPSLFAPGVSSTVPNGSLVSSDAHPKVKKIAFSTPLKHKKPRGHRDRQKKNVDAAAVKEAQEVENIEDASTSPGCRSSISDQQISVLGNRAGNGENIEVGDLTHVRKLPSNGLRLSETSAVSSSHLDNMLTDKQLFTFTQADVERAPTANSQTVAGSLSRPVEEQDDRTVNKLIKGIGGAKYGQDHTVSDSNKVSIPGIRVCGAELTSPLDLKTQSAVTAAHQPAITTPPRPFGMTFFSKFREPDGGTSKSQVSRNGCSTETIKRNFGGIVHTRNRSLQLGKCEPQTTATETSEKSVNPFSFVEDDDEIECYERVEDTKGKFRIPATKGKKKRVLNTPAKGVVLDFDSRESPTLVSERRNNELCKNNRSQKRKNKKCLLNISNDDGMYKITSRRKSEKQMTEEISTRRSLRPRKKVTCKEMSSGESGVSFELPQVSANLLKMSSRRRKTEPLRSECVTLSPTPSGSAPPSVDVDLGALSPPRLFTNCELEPPESTTPPLEINMVRPSPPKSKPARGRKRKMKNVVQNCTTRESEAAKSAALQDELVSLSPQPKLGRARNKGKKMAGHEGGWAPSKAAPHVEILAQTIPRNVPATSSSLADQPMPLTAGDGVDNQAALQIEDHTRTISHDDGHTLLSTLASPADRTIPHITDKTASVGASSTSQVPLSNSNHLGWIDALGHLILSHVKTYVNGVVSDNTSVMDSIEVNFSTCLEALKRTMNTIREESMSIARSTANVQSACENCVAHFDVVLEMMKVIEDVHRESAIAASVRNNDPRTYSQLRQQIYELISNNISKIT